MSKFHRHFEGVDVDPKCLVTAPGTKELIFLTMKVFNGPVVLVNPGWSTYAPQVRLAGKTLHVVNTTAATQWKVQPHALDIFLTENCRDDDNKLLVLNNPGNPSGTVYSPAELKDLVYDEILYPNKVSTNAFIDHRFHEFPEKCLSIVGKRIMDSVEIDKHFRRCEDFFPKSVRRRLPKAFFVILFMSPGPGGPISESAQ